MTTDAIQQDVSEDAGGSNKGEQGAEVVLSARDLAMREISGQLTTSRAEERGAVPIVETPPPKLDQMVKVKIDGQEMELPLSEVTKGYQKDAVASRRLSQAADERRQLEELKQELEARERALAQGSLSSASLDDDLDVDSQLKAVMSAMVEGDEEKAAAAMKLILSGRQQTTPIDEEAIIAKAEARITARTAEHQAEAERKSAWNEFVGSNAEFAEETSKQRQYGDFLFDSKYAPLIQSGELSYRQALQQTAEEVAGMFDNNQTVVTPRQQKEERKKAIDNLPIASARAVQKTAAPKSAEDIINEMRRGRGQPV
jgi:hypothetical protein